MWRTLQSWLYRHDWQLAGVLAVAVIGLGGFVLWPRPAPTATPVPLISSDEIDAAQERTVIVYLSGAGPAPGLLPLAGALPLQRGNVGSGRPTGDCGTKLLAK